MPNLKKVHEHIINNKKPFFHFHNFHPLSYTFQSYSIIIPSHNRLQQWKLSTR